MKAAVIIVKYGAEKQFRACMASVRRATPESAPVVVHDNRPKNENLGKLWNRLIRALPEEIDVAVLLNSDTVVTKGWLGQLAAGVDKGYAAVGPVTNRCGYPTQIRRRHPKIGYLEVQALSGFCVAINRGAFEKLGGFREDFPVYGQDSDLFMRMRRSSMRIAIARHVFVRHAQAASSKEAHRRGDINLGRERKKAVEMYRKAVAAERRLRPRMLGLVSAGPGQEGSEDCLRRAGMDEVHVVPHQKVKAFLKSRQVFFEGAVCLEPGQLTYLSREDALGIALNGGGLSVTRLPMRRGDA